MIPKLGSTVWPPGHNPCLPLHPRPLALRTAATFRKYSTVFVSPSRSCTVDSQSRTARAWAMSGLTLGRVIRRERKVIVPGVVADDPRDEAGQLEHGELA